MRFELIKALQTFSVFEVRLLTNFHIHGCPESCRQLGTTLGGMKQCCPPGLPAHEGGGESRCYSCHGDLERIFVRSFPFWREQEPWATRLGGFKDPVDIFPCFYSRVGHVR